MNLFPLHSTDAYKLGHRAMMQQGTELLYSNLTPRSDRLFKGGPLFDHKMVVFGIQGFIKEFLIETFNAEFFSQPKQQAVARYKRRVDTMMGEGVIPVDGVAALHDLGYLPLRIMALAEGSRVNMKIPVLTIQNTRKDFPWLVNYIEPVLSNSIWKSSTNATIAYEYRRVFEHFAELTGTPLEAVQWQGHDFSSRGMSGPEDVARSGSAHLLSFTGTDAVSAIDYLEDYYNADATKELIGGSVPATEHSISSSNILFHVRRLKESRPGFTDEQYLQLGEIAFLMDYITRIVPTGLASYVADTYDYWGLLYILSTPDVFNTIMARDGKLVIRPDSGNPVHVLCGYKLCPTEFAHQDNFADHVIQHGFFDLDDYEAVRIGNKYFKLEKTLVSYIPSEEILEHEIKGSVEVLWNIFGGTRNAKGYKELDSHIGIIYGDSITLERQWGILQRLMDKGFASGNVVLGIGSYTYNYSTRDTFGSAVKATATVIDGEFIEIFKDPKTGDPLKKSAKGFLAVERDGSDYALFDQQDSVETGELNNVLLDGVVTETSLAAIRGELIG